jgi:hypothetical protein
MDRVELLKFLINTKFAGNKAAFARAIKKPAALVSQWISRHRLLGDGSARNIEAKLDLGLGWFDAKVPILTQTADETDTTPKITPRQQAILDLFNELTESQQEEIFQNLQEKKLLNNTLLNELLKRKTI